MHCRSSNFATLFITYTRKAHLKHFVNSRGCTPLNSETVVSVTSFAIRGHRVRKVANRLKSLLTATVQKVLSPRTRVLSYTKNKCDIVELQMTTYFFFN